MRGYGMDVHEKIADVFDKLPIDSFSLTSDTVRECYVKELSTITNSDDLRAFVKKWSTVWTIPYTGKKSISDFEKSLIDGSFDADAALECIKKNRDGVCEHITENKIGCIAPDIMAPGLLVVSTLMSMRFGVPFNTAFHQVILSGLIVSEKQKKAAKRRKALKAGMCRHGVYPRAKCNDCVIETLTKERDEARAIARILAYSYYAGPPPANLIRAAMDFPVVTGRERDIGEENG